MKKYWISAVCCFLLVPALAQQNIAEQLGYPADTRLLIIHADDLGVSHSENMASISAMENGCVNSASIMVPCPWFPEIARYASGKNMDFGLHLTITSEWDNYKWGPVSSRNQVGSLLNRQGYFYASVDSVRSHALPGEVETEIRNQVLKALAAGIDVTHLDTHMGALGATPEIISVYLKAGREFRLPVLLTPEIKQTGIVLTNRDVVLDKLFMASPENYEEGLSSFYEEVLSSLEPGLNCLLIHSAYENQEMQAVTINHEAYGAHWRQLDYDFFTSDKCSDLIRENNIVLVTWKEIRDKIVRRK